MWRAGSNYGASKNGNLLTIPENDTYKYKVIQK